MRRFRLGVAVQLWCIPQGQEMDRASAVEADPVSGPLVDILRPAEWLQEIALKDRVTHPLEEGAALLEGHVREPAARDFAGETRIGRINNLA